jgi:hypothetical protein
VAGQAHDTRDAARYAVVALLRLAGRGCRKRKARLEGLQTLVERKTLLEHGTLLEHETVLERGPLVEAKTLAEQESLVEGCASPHGRRLGPPARVLVRRGEREGRAQARRAQARRF